MKRLAVLLALLASSTSANAQSVQQSGKVTPEHVPVWATNGVIKDGGTAANPLATSFGVVGGQNCANSAPITSPYNALCFQALTTGGVISLNNFGGATGGLSFKINGTSYQFPYTVGGIVGPGSTTVGHLATWNNTVGTLLADGQALSQAVTGNWAFNPASGTAITITPANGANQGLIINQTGTNSGSLSADFVYNSINVNSDGLANTQKTYAFQSTLNVAGSNATGQKYGLYGLVTNLSPGLVTGGDLVGVRGRAWANQTNGGTNTGAGAVGTLYGMSPSCLADVGALNYYVCSGGEVDVIVKTGATVKHRWGWVIAANGDLQGASTDAGLDIGGVSVTAPFQNGIFFDNIHGQSPIATTGCIMCTDGTADTIGTGIDLSPYTITGNFLKGPSGFAVSGATGVVTAPSYVAGSTVGASCPSGVTAGTVVVIGGIVTHC